MSHLDTAIVALELLGWAEAGGCGAALVPLLCACLHALLAEVGAAPPAAAAPASSPAGAGRPAAASEPDDADDADAGNKCVAVRLTLVSKAG